MKNIYACHCGSTLVLRDAYVALNDPENVHTFDSLCCGDCGYDGHSDWHQVELPEDHVDEGWVDKALLTPETQTYL